MSDTIIERLNGQIVDLEAKGECPLVVAELRDYKRHITALELGLAAAEQREAVLRECVELYANQAHWHRHVLISDRSAWWGRGSAIVINEQGCEPAQAALARVEKVSEGGA